MASRRLGMHSRPDGPAHSDHAKRDDVTRLSDLPPDQAKRLAELECPDFKARPWVTGPALSQRRIAIVTSAGLVVRGEEPFRGRDPDYRAIPSTVATGDLLPAISRSTSDRTGFQEDWNVVFPLDRLNELAAEVDDRLGRDDALFVHGRDRSGAYGASCARTCRSARGRCGRRRHSSSRLTVLYARRERARALSRRKKA